jgi:DNA invertase Pin-like site-specific DNA recombinase
MKIGYARVSTGDQNPDLQLVALKATGCDKIVTDKVHIHAGRGLSSRCRSDGHHNIHGLCAIWQMAGIY